MFRSARIALVVTCAAIGLTACSSSTSKPATATRLRGGTATYAEASAPNFIFPFMGSQTATVSNGPLFQGLMYRPLYFFGTGSSPALNTSLSLADPPSYSRDGKTAVVTIKPYRWSNGESVTAADVVFWMNMMHADKTDWVDYSPGTMPDNVVSVTADGARRVTFVFNRSYNPTWMTYNQLSQITPMPRAWDVSRAGAAAGTGGCFAKAYGTADPACRAVFTYLSKQAGFDPSDPSKPATSISTYATNPLWQVVDGPWHLTAFDAQGDLTMAPNPSYSGPVKPSLAQFKEVAFTGDTAEYDALRAGSLDVGYLPSQDAPATANALVAPSAGSGLSGYRLDPLYGWGFGYLAYNFHSTGDHGLEGRILSQLYVRQAMQRLVDQSLYIAKIYNGWGLPNYGPVPPLPPNPFASAAASTNPYPYDVAAAARLLRSHGWKVAPGGASACVEPGAGPAQCGAGIPAGARLDFSIDDTPGDSAETLLLAAEKSSWSQVGINVDIRSESNTAIAQDYAPCSGPRCTWGILDDGWLYQPDIYPTGESLFATGAASNSGSYSDPTNDANIQRTYRTAAPLTQYEDYLARELPVIWQPRRVSIFTEYRDNLHGLTPQNILFAITPENWYFTK